jgi:hypothetical protein
MSKLANEKIILVQGTRYRVQEGLQTTDYGQQTINLLVINYLAILFTLHYYLFTRKPLAVFRVRTEPESAQSWKAMGCGS